ncbi:MAG: TIGR04222 domain-containing membrane protein [Xanthomonadales bacterium]|jgi:uncharacterized protein (TIGR04222 family)|nr:TIGR04222 domain-containing membrane protein [Xanthomonadales bacterium]
MDVWTAASHERWARICAHPFADPAQGLDFRRRLAREQGWSLVEADAAIEEYRRFCWLACSTGQPVTPSDDVDQVWHLHLTCTEDYWLHYCPKVLRHSLHHSPTRGGVTEAARYRDQYAATLAAYERAFGTPPVRWWPGTRERFARPARWVRVDRTRHWLLPKPDPRRALTGARAALAALIGFGSAGSAHAQANPLDWTAGPFLTLYLALIVAVFILNRLWRRQLSGPNDATGTDTLGTDEIAYLSGGPTRVLDVQVASLLDSGHLELDARDKRLRFRRQEGLSGLAAQVARAVAVEGNPAKLERRLRSALEAPRQALVQRRLWLDEAARQRARFSLALLPALLCGFGLAKIAVGLSRDRPILFISLLTAFVALYTLVQLLNPPTRSLRGDQALRTLNLRHARAARAPLAGELPLAVALAGTAVLGGTAHAAWHQTRHPPASDSSGGGSTDSDGGSSSDGDGGGSGCGGCGGGGD